MGQGTTQGEEEPYKNGWFSWFMLILLLGVSAISLIFQGAPRANKDDFPQVSNYKANEKCDQEITSFKPNYAPEGWHIQCVDKIKPRAIKGRGVQSLIYGLTYADKDKTIEISRATPVNILHHVILHEWVHAYVFQNNLENKVQWREWEKYLKDEGNIIDNGNYEGNPNEILADNVAAATGHDAIVNGVMRVDANEIWKLFPALKPIDAG